jgi:hypothetical protein
MDVNAFQNEQLAVRFVNAFGPYLPLFTNMMIDPQRHSADFVQRPSKTVHPWQYTFTEGSTERWMRAIKNEIVIGTNSLPTFMEQMSKSILGRQRLLLNTLSSRTAETTMIENTNPHCIESNSINTQSIDSEYIQDQSIESQKIQPISRQSQHIQPECISETRPALFECLQHLTGLNKVIHKSNCLRFCFCIL